MRKPPWPMWMAYLHLMKRVGLAFIWWVLFWALLPVWIVGTAIAYGADWLSGQRNPSEEYARWKRAVKILRAEGLLR